MSLFARVFVHGSLACSVAVFMAGCTSLLGDFSAGRGDDASAPPAAQEDGSAPPSDAALSSDAPGVVSDGATSAEASPNGCAPGQLVCSAGCVSATDLRTCGRCDNDCTSLPHVLAAGLSCSATGECTFQCAPGHLHCSTNPADGCETDVTAASHCGSCTTTCSGATPICGPVGESFGCLANCPAKAPTLCTDTCSDLSSDSNHCGDCNAPCAGGETCQASMCACPAPETLCGTVCYSTQDDPTHCGAACTSCPAPPNGAATCAGGNCTPKCNPGFDGCGGATACAYNTSNDAAHCGAGCAQCTGAAPVCLNGGCVACTPGTTSCSSNTPQTCSSAGAWVLGAACASPTVCSGGSCVCGAPYTTCSGACVDTDSNFSNCGSCGHVCGSGSTCSGGACHTTCVSVACGTQICGCGGTCCSGKCCLPP